MAVCVLSGIFDCDLRDREVIHSFISAGPSRATAGPGKHYHGVLSPPPPILYVLRSRRRRRREGGNMVQVSVVSSPSGVQGGAPAENGFYAYFRSERSHLEHHFQYF